MGGERGSPGRRRSSRGSRPRPAPRHRQQPSAGLPPAAGAPAVGATGPATSTFQTDALGLRWLLWLSRFGGQTRAGVVATWVSEGELGTHCRVARGAPRGEGGRTGLPPVPLVGALSSRGAAGPAPPPPQRTGSQGSRRVASAMSHASSELARVEFGFRVPSRGGHPARQLPERVWP